LAESFDAARVGSTGGTLGGFVAQDTEPITTGFYGLFRHNVNELPTR